MSEPAPASTPAHPLKKVLLVEDLEDDIVLFQVISEKCGIPHTLEIKEDGQAAMDHLQSLPPGDLPAIVLLDMKMPKASGLEVLGWIRKQERFSAMPVIMFTSSSDPDDITKALTLGANSFITKTGSMDQLRTIVQVTFQYWFEIHRHGR
jgi:CheY-like chemotaxis protein